MLPTIQSEPEHHFHQSTRQEAYRRKYWLGEDRRRRELADDAVRYVERRLVDLGLSVSYQSHNAHFDLLASSPSQSVRVEVKAATFRSGRYQAALRGNQADVLVLVCRIDRHTLQAFVIPFHSIHASNIAVWSQDLERYSGVWRQYLECWSIVLPAALCGRTIDTDGA